VAENREANLDIYKVDIQIGEDNNMVMNTETANTPIKEKDSLREFE
jgi:hypothetical protein